jgi:branched-chain amino acid transport system substrate-binding protein
MNHFIITFSLIFFIVFQTEGQTVAQTDSLEKPPSVLDLPAEFSGWNGTAANAKLIKEVRIGLFLPSNSVDFSSQSFIKAANLAIEEINVSGGYQGIPYRLINRWSSDPWGAGSKEMIKLVYQDSVWAVIGSIDGDATHIAEQIATKAWLPLLSPLSADPTLTYIRIPWIFRLPPDFKAQSEAIVKQGLKSGHLDQVGLITENSHDGRVFAKEINDVLINNNTSPLFHLEVSKSNLIFSSIIQRAISFNPRTIIIYLAKDNILNLLSKLGDRTKEIDVVIPWIPGLDYDIISKHYKAHIYYIAPFLRSPNPAYEKFAIKYQKYYNSNPTFGAAYTYDAVYLLAHALQKSGLNHAKLRDAIATIKNIQGVTGNISWDNGGGNQAKPILRVLKYQEYLD